MHTRRFPMLFVALATLLLGTPWTGAAHADDGPAPRGRPAQGPPERDQDFVAQLTPEEVAFLRKRIQGWDDLDARKKQMMARNVLRIRNMSPEQRKQFEERLAKMRGGGRGFAEGPHGVILVNRALAQAALTRLGHDFEQRLRRSDISSYVFEMSFARAFWSRVADSAFAEGEPVAPVALPQDVSRRHLERYAKAYSAWKEEEDAARRAHMRKRLGFAYHALRAERLRQSLAQSGAKGPEAYVEAMALKVQETWPRELASMLEDPEALLRAAEDEEVRRSLRRLLRRDGRLEREESALLVRLAERWAGARPAGDGAGVADALILRLLGEDLKVPAETLSGMPPREQVEARAAWLRGVFARYAGLRGRSAHGGGPPGRGEPRNGLGGKGPGGKGPGGKGPGGRRGGMIERPEGVGEAAWSAVQDAVREAIRTRAWPPKQPEAVDDATWAKVLEAFKSRRSGR